MTTSCAFRTSDGLNFKFPHPQQKWNPIPSSTAKMEPYFLIHSQNGTLFPHPQPKWNPISSSTAKMEPYFLITQPKWNPIWPSAPKIRTSLESIANSRWKKNKRDRCCYLLLAWPGLAAGSSNGLTNTWRRICSFELLTMDGKSRLKHVERLTEINKLRNVASCWLYCSNILALHGSYAFLVDNYSQHPSSAVSLRDFSLQRAADINTQNSHPTKFHIQCQWEIFIHPLPPPQLYFPFKIMGNTVPLPEAWLSYPFSGTNYSRIRTFNFTSFLCRKWNPIPWSSNQ